MSASISKFWGQAALIAVIIFGGLVMGALTPAYSSDVAGAEKADTRATPAPKKERLAVRRGHAAALSRLKGPYALRP